MLVPGTNLLNMAMRVIAPQTLVHKAFVERTENAVGDTVTVYAAPVEISGSMQAINKSLYQEMGLNIAKNYANLYTSADVRPTGRDVSGDLVIYGGRTWLCESDMHWGEQDGWRKLQCVEVPA